MRALVLTGVLLIASPAGASPEWELGEPPMRVESQDTTTWSRPLIPKSGKPREQVVALYKSAYLPGAATVLNWNGSVANCNPGLTNVEHQQAVIARVNYYRALVDLPSIALLGATETTQEQAAALMMSANNALSHTPPATWLCFSAGGASGAGNSNIALGVRGVAAIDLFMDDPGSGNGATGHRRWILFPPRAAMATGDVSGGNTPPRPANALYVTGPSITRPATPNGIAWPPAGFVPYQNLPSQSNRWSLSYPGADFHAATVTVTGPGGPMPVAYEAIANGYGDNTIVFLPTGFPYSRPGSDTTYAIVVSGIAGASAPATLAYNVTVTDPDTAVASPPTVDVIEFYNATFDHYFITWVTDEIANLDAGRTPTRWNRTGYHFRAYATEQAGTSPVCRFYIPPSQGDSHFFGRDASECTGTALKNPEFDLEASSFMALFLPVAGNCPGGTLPIYRVFSNRADANHRYMTDPVLRDQMVARGWLAEGDGPNRVVMCAPV